MSSKKQNAIRFVVICEYVWLIERKKKFDVVQKRFFAGENGGISGGHNRSIRCESFSSGLVQIVEGPPHS